MNWEIIPIQKLARFDTLTYEAPKNSKFCTGQLVYVPLKNITIPGLIYKPTRGKVFYQLKEIIGLFDIKPILSPTQIDFCQWMASNYICSLSEVCYQLIPAKFRKVRKKDLANSFLPNSNYQAPISKSQPLYKKMSIYFQGGMKSRFLEYKKIIQKTAGQTLIITPDINIIPQSIIKLLPDIYIHNTNTPKVEFESWQTIYKNQPKAILGSHKSLLLPIKKMKNVILDQENHPQIQYDQKPYYDLRIAIKDLAKQNNSNLYIGSNFPSLITYQEIHLNKLQLKNISPVKLAKIFIIPTDKQTPVEKQNLSYQSEKIISQNLICRTPIVLLILKKGFAQALICKSCMTVLNCIKCGKNLRLVESQKLYCANCKQDTMIPSNCNICKSTNLEIIGLGQLGIENYLKQTYPKAKISTLENSKKFDIAVITPRNLAQVGKINDLILVYPESMLSNPNYNIKEKLHQIIYSARMICNNLYIQTQIPKNKFWQIIQDPRNFLESELSNRKKYGLPPAKKIIMVQGPSPEISKIQDKIQTKNTVLGPAPVLSNSKLYQIIIKTNNDNFPEIAKILNKIKSVKIRYKIDPIDL
ncbi:MAG: hypothetical protein ABH837_01160 [bacterium]